MQALTDFIFGGATELTPYTLVAFMSFVLVLSCISSIVESTLSAHKM